MAKVELRRYTSCKPTWVFVQDQALHVGAAHRGDFGLLHGLGVSVPEALTGEHHLPDDRPALYHGDRELASLGGGLVDPYPALLEHEERLAEIHRRVESLAPLDTGVEVLPVDVLYLLRARAARRCPPG